MFHRRGGRRPPNRETAEEIAANALAFVAADARRLGQFLSATGLSPDELRRRASSPGMLLAILDYLLQEESLLLVFAANAGIDPADVGPARQLLAGSTSGE
ncbi:MAG TPA: DUF3572 domain-containing protein [Hyphomicrobiaceae bacterium]|nr:DUF3572 domain-containing protein [Hyphomicrobiaceae bacterium]